jgi:hypothetical protein
MNGRARLNCDAMANLDALMIERHALPDSSATATRRRLFARAKVIVEDRASKIESIHLIRGAGPNRRRRSPAPPSNPADIRSVSGIMNCEQPTTSTRSVVTLQELISRSKAGRLKGDVTGMI